MAKTRIAPTVTSPKDGVVFPSGATINVQATASDPDGSISKVEFLLDNGGVLTDTTVPYAFSVSGLSPQPDRGLTVVAYDNLGNRTFANVVVDIGIQVNAYRGTVSPANPGEPTYYNPGQIVTVTADAAPTGMVFDQWSGDVGDLDNPFLATAKVKVPGNRHVSLEALYKPAPNPTVLKLVLFNADTDKPIAGYDPLYNGAVLTLSKLPTRNLNVRVVTTPEPTGSVQVAWDAGMSAAFNRVENFAPYALAEDINGDYRPWQPAVGHHTLTAWAYTGNDKAGTKSLPLTINLLVVE